MATKTRKKGAAVQGLLGIKSFGSYGIVTGSGEIVLYSVAPTNITVLSAASIEGKIRQLMLVLSAVPDIEIVCTDSAECFDENKVYLLQRAEKEQNGEVQQLLKKDIVFLDKMQSELSTARKFIFAVRCKNMKESQIFEYTNGIQKIICEQGFDAHRMTKAEIKRFMALYFDATLYGEQMQDVDGAENFKTDG